MKGLLARLPVWQFVLRTFFYLFHCDSDWNELIGTRHYSIEDAKKQAEFEYRGIAAHWNPAPSFTQAALFEAIENHHPALVSAVLENGGDPNLPASDQDAWVPLKHAIEAMGDGGPLETVVLLLRAGAKIEGGTRPGNATPLLVAVMHRQLDVARILLACGADSDRRDDEGDTPLSIALMQGYSEIEQLLRSCGATAGPR